MRTFLVLLTALAATVLVVGCTQLGLSPPSSSPPKSVTLTPGSTAYGSMQPAKTETLNSGTATAITATPASGYVFSSWSAVPAPNASFANAASASTIVTLSGDATVTPVFNVAPSSGKAITAFSITSVSPTAVGTISGTNISVTVPYATSVNALVATFTTTGTSVQVGSTAQVSGVTANNFSSPVTYTVVAQDGSTQNYAVTVTVASLSVTYDANQATRGTVPVDSNYYSQGATVGVYPNTGSLVKTGYAFSGWNTQADGSGTTYQPYGSFTMGSTNVILYVLWLPTHTVTYDANASGTSGSVPTDSQGYTAGSTVTIQDNPGSLARSGYELAGWNTNAAGTGTSYPLGSYNTFTMGSANVTLYAEWVPVYTVTYDANGATSGTVPADSNTYLSGATVTILLNTGSLSKTGEQFAGWNTKSDGTGTDYAATNGNTLQIGSSNVVLYALWIDSNLSLSESGNTVSVISCNSTISGSYTIPNGITDVSNGGLEGLSGLTSVTIPSTVVTLSPMAFNADPNLSSISVSAANTHFTVVGGVIFDSSGTTLVAAPPALAGTYTVPSTVQTIGASAFETADTALTSVVIPASVTSIGDNAFNYCYALTSVTMQSTVPPAVTSGTFLNDAPSFTIHVPSGYLATYQAATDWSSYTSILVSP